MLFGPKIKDNQLKDLKYNQNIKEQIIKKEKMNVHLYLFYSQKLQIT